MQAKNKKSAGNLWFTSEQVEDRDKSGKCASLLSRWKIKKMAGNMWVFSEQVENQENGRRHVALWVTPEQVEDEEKGGKHVGHS